MTEMIGGRCWWTEDTYDVKGIGMDLLRLTIITGTDGA